MHFGLLHFISLYVHRNPSSVHYFPPIHWMFVVNVHLPLAVAEPHAFCAFAAGCCQNADEMYAIFKCSHPIWRAMTHRTCLFAFNWVWFVKGVAAALNFAYCHTCQFILTRAKPTSPAGLINFIYETCINHHGHAPGGKQAGRYWIICIMYSIIRVALLPNVSVSTFVMNKHWLENNFWYAIYWNMRRERQQHLLILPIIFWLQWNGFQISKSQLYTKTYLFGGKNGIWFKCIYGFKRD